MTESSESQDLPQCKCGFTREDVTRSVHVQAKPEYNGIGWCLLLFGITARPSLVRFVCTQCNQLIEESTDPAVLKEFS